MNTWVTTSDGSAPVYGGNVVVHSSNGNSVQGTYIGNGTVYVPPSK